MRNIFPTQRNHNIPSSQAGAIIERIDILAARQEQTFKYVKSQASRARPSIMAWIISICLLAASGFLAGLSTYILIEGSSNDSGSEVLLQEASALRVEALNNVVQAGQNYELAEGNELQAPESVSGAVNATACAVKWAWFSSIPHVWTFGKTRHG